MPSVATECNNTQCLIKLTLGRQKTIEKIPEDNHSQTAKHR